MAQARASQVGDYVEVGDASALATQVGNYVEVGDAAALATQVGAYIEIAINETRATMVGAYIEILPPPPDVRAIYASERHYTVLYNDIDLTAYCRLGDLEGVADQLDTENLASEYPTSEPGKITWRVSLGGILDKALDDVLGSEALTPTFRDLEILVGEPLNRTRYTWIATDATGAFVNNYRVGPNVQFGEIPFAAEIAVSGAPTRRPY